jgi:hypothetical protein
MEEIKPVRSIRIELPDQMRHFSRNGPVTKLLALLICTLPRLVAASAAMAAALGRLIGWW